MRTYAGLVAGPILLLLVLLSPSPAGLSPAGWHTAGVALLMAVWWITEAIPIAATALLPLVLFPLLGVLPIVETAAPYANPLIFLFLGGFVVAIAVEQWGLHRRIALGIIHRLGSRPTRIVAGFMIASAFLSMWVSNTATTMMMLPIGMSVVGIVKGTSGASRSFAAPLLLGIAYASSVGGMATLVGTPANALLAGFALEAYGREIAFASWFAMGIVIVVLALPIVYLILTRIAFRVEGVEDPAAAAVLLGERARLRGISRAEGMVAGVFVLVAVLWMTRPLLDDVVPGLNDASIAIGAALLLFLLPVDLRQRKFVLDWEAAGRLPWGVLLLFGGGLSLAAAINDTGLASWLGAQTSDLMALPFLVLVGLIVAVIIFLTELTSNTATAAAFIPVVASVAVGLGADPLLLAVPATFASSCAFMLPVATPPNAIIYGSGAVEMRHMVRAGILLNLTFILLVTGLTYVLVPLILG